MSGRYLLDTPVVMALLANETPVRTQLQKADEVFLSIFALGELYFAARGTTQLKRNLDQIDALAEQVSVLKCDVETARHYGALKETTFAKGIVVSENDLWMAALARQYELVLVTRDDHFKKITGLKIVKW